MSATELTAAKKDTLLHHVREGMRPGAAGEAMGFPRDTIYRLLEDDEDFAAMVADAEREATEHVEEALYQAAISGNVTACRMWMDLRRPAKTTDLALRDDNADFDSELAELNKLAAGD